MDNRLSPTHIERGGEELGLPPTTRNSGTKTLNIEYNPFEKQIVTVYGPYLRGFRKEGDERRQVVIHFKDGSRTSMSYSRWLMTQSLHRTLGSDEHVDHINEDKLDDRIENLQILTPSENSIKSGTGRPSQQKGIEKGWRHGTFYSWMKKKCECEECETAKRSFHDQRNKKRRLTGGTRGTYGLEVPHGSKRMYSRGCKCDDCRKANSLYEASRLRGEPKSSTERIVD